MPTMTTDDYLTLPYRIALVHDQDDEGNQGWVAEVEELPGCLSQGATPEEAVERVRDAMVDWIDAELEAGHTIPEPRALKPYSGRLLLRMPRSLHATLAHQAEQEGVSLNQHIVALLAYTAGARRDRESATA